ncbi:MAG: Lrp/AsnC family transcriptional regulator [Alphaproteobacteria bacterium]|nr:Lrp/AsnC family transcriptional regulator [Alphaproteobacteria bacterium]
MELTDRDRDLLAALQEGLPLVERPYREIADRLGCREDEVIARLAGLIDTGIIKRLGVVVRHHELGYRANAMVVWDVPDRDVEDAGRRLAALPYVTLCYRRPRRLPEWPYNLFCMIHGRNREAVEGLIAEAASACRLGAIPRETLFSTRRFKQRGARYDAAEPGAAAVAAEMA